MNFMQAVKTCFSKYATFSGRAVRSEYWWWILFIFAVQIILSVFLMGSMDFTAIASDDPKVAMDAMMAAYTGPIGIFLMLFSLATLIPTLAAGSRRLHDTGKSGWWQLLWLLGIIPLAGLLAMIAVIYLMVQKSQEGSNKYG